MLAVGGRSGQMLDSIPYTTKNDEYFQGCKTMLRFKIPEDGRRGAA